MNNEYYIYFFTYNLSNVDVKCITPGIFDSVS